jgi:hypothetical protein
MISVQNFITIDLSCKYDVLYTFSRSSRKEDRKNPKYSQLNCDWGLYRAWKKLNQQPGFQSLSEVRGVQGYVVRGSDHNAPVWHPVRTLITPCLTSKYIWKPGNDVQLGIVYCLNPSLCNSRTWPVENGSFKTVYFKRCLWTVRWTLNPWPKIRLFTMLRWKIQKLTWCFSQVSLFFRDLLSARIAEIICTLPKHMERRKDSAACLAQCFSIRTN